MSFEPTIICPSCQTEIKLTESLAALLIASTKRDFEKRLAEQGARVQQKELALRQGEESLAKARESLDEQVAEKLKKERSPKATAITIPSWPQQQRFQRRRLRRDHRPWRLSFFLHRRCDDVCDPKGWSWGGSTVAGNWAQCISALKAVEQRSTR